MIGENAIKLIEHFEGLSLIPYLCPAGIATIGYGHAITAKGEFLRGENGLIVSRLMFPGFDEKQATDLLKIDLEKTEKIINSKLSVELKQHELDALISHVYNCGISSTLFCYINRSKKAYINKILEFWKTHYITASGIKMPGLVKRRLVEANLFETGILNFDV